MSIEHHIGKKKQWYYALLRNDVKTCDKFYNNKLTSLSSWREDWNMILIDI